MRISHMHIPAQAGIPLYFNKWDSRFSASASFGVTKRQNLGVAAGEAGRGSVRGEVYEN